jgi:Protein of unknown function (DUF3592)
MVVDSGLTVVILGVASVLAGVIYLYKIIKASNYFKVEGRICDSRAILSRREANDISWGEYFSSSRKSTTKKYKAKLVYEYEVEGKFYQSTRVYSFALMPIKVKDILCFTYGAKVPVWYDPNSPGDSFLIKTGIFPVVAFFILGVGAFVFYGTI